VLEAVKMGEEMIKKKRLLIALLILCFPIYVFAETITLKSGKTVEGKLIEKTDKYVKIDFLGVPITYFTDEIEKVVSDNSPVVKEKEDKVNLVIVGDVALTYASYFFKLSPDWYPDMDQYMLTMVQQKGFWRGKHKNGKVYILIAPTKIRSGNTADDFINGSKELMKSKGASVKNYDFKPNLSYPYEVYFEYLPKLNRYGLIVFAKLPEHVIHFSLYTMGEDLLSSYSGEFNRILASFKWTLGLSDEEIGKIISGKSLPSNIPLNASFPKAVVSTKTVTNEKAKTLKKTIDKGIAFAKVRKYDEAISEFNKAIELNPNTAEAYFNRGHVYGFKGNPDQSISDFTKAIGINPNFVDAYKMRASAYFLKQEFDKAWNDVHKLEAMGYKNPQFTELLKESSGRQN